MVELKYPKGTPIECYKKILKVILSIHSNIDPSVVDIQFNTVDRLISTFDRLFSDQIEIDRIKGFLVISKDLRYRQIKKEYNERH